MAAKTKIGTISISVVVLLLAAVIFVIPLSPDSLIISPSGVRRYIAFLLVAACFNLESVWLFWLGFGNFKRRLRPAYRALCGALLALSLAILQVPVVGLIGAIWWLNLGPLNLLYIASAILLFTASRSFARLLDIQGLSTSLRFSMSLGVFLSMASLTLPAHTSVLQPNATGIHIGLASDVFNLVLLSLTAYNLYRIKQVLGGIYKHAMQWLVVACAVYALGQVHSVILQIIGYQNWYAISGWSTLISALTSVIFLRAGYAFWQIGAPGGVVRDASALDVVIYTASLATDLHAIERPLDQVRQLTAHLEPGQALTSEQQLTLVRVYAELEQYLTQAEPLRRMTRTDLRERLEHTFPHDTTHPDFFWRHISTD